MENNGVSISLKSLKSLGFNVVSTLCGINVHFTHILRTFNVCVCVVNVVYFIVPVRVVNFLYVRTRRKIEDIERSREPV